jgi:DASS family divalent anion:Na+ symporter
MPSNTARAGGVIAPIVQSLSRTFGSNPNDGTERKIGAFLNLAAFQGDMITSAMFMTAMAANPMTVDLAKKTLGIDMTWGSWFLAALVPGLVALIVIPFLIYTLYKPEITKTEGASKLATDKLLAMGPIKKDEWLMIFAFVLLLALWIFGSNFGIDATAAAFVGLGVLLITQVLTWDDIKAEKGAWDTLVWFAALVMLASYMNSLGFIPWFSATISNSVLGMSWVLGFAILVIVYLYSHYFFASSTAHVSAMYVAFLSVLSGTLAEGVIGGGIGVPAMLACLALAFFSNLCGGITHYGSGAAPAFFGAGYVTQNRWWGMGFICSVANIVIWLGVGGLWWKILGLW